MVWPEILSKIISAIVGAVIAGLSGLCGWLWQRHKKDTADADAIRAGMMALLHDRIFQAAHFYCEARGWCSLEDKRNVEYMYKPYAELGGNGTGKSAYEAIMALPTEPPKGE